MSQEFLTEAKQWANGGQYAVVIKGVISTLNILPIGSSGSGKSHTMNGGFTKTKGANWDEGIAPRVIRYAFAAWESEPDWKYHSTVDLCGHQKGRVASNVNGIIEWTQVTSATDLIGAFRAACNSRKTETTERNKSSSRSSLMFEMVSQRIIEGRADRAQRHQASGRSFTFFGECPCAVLPVSAQRDQTFRAKSSDALPQRQATSLRLIMPSCSESIPLPTGSLILWTRRKSSESIPGETIAQHGMSRC